MPHRKFQSWPTRRVLPPTPTLSGLNRAARRFRRTHQGFALAPARNQARHPVARADLSGGPSRAVAGRGRQYHFQTAGAGLGLSCGTAGCFGADPFHPGADGCVVAGTGQPPAHSRIPPKFPHGLRTVSRWNCSPRGSPEFILSIPDAVVNGLPVTRLDVTQHGLHPLAGARLVLQNHPPLTFGN